jgi:hypothetical protein
MVAKGMKMICQLLFFPHIAPAGLFLCPREESELADVSLSQDSFEKSWDGVLRTIAKTSPPPPFGGR